MSQPRYYRGGNSLKPRVGVDVLVDPDTGLLRPDRGISVESVPDGLDRFGGAYEVTNLPATLKVIKRGRRPSHFEIAPGGPMTLDEYEDALGQIVLVPVTAQESGNDGTA